MLDVQIIARRGNEMEVVGTLRLEKGKVVADPPDALGLKNTIAEPIRVMRDGELTEIRADKEPAAFLENLHVAYSGSAFRATKPRMGDGTGSR